MEIKLFNYGRLLIMQRGTRVVHFNAPVMRLYDGMNVEAIGTIDYAKAYEWLKGEQNV